jgi:hypothetical protein
MKRRVERTWVLYDMTESCLSCLSVHSAWGLMLPVRGRGVGLVVFFFF